LEKQQETSQMKGNYKYKPGDRVLYGGTECTIVGRWTSSGSPGYVISVQRGNSPSGYWQYAELEDQDAIKNYQGQVYWTAEIGLSPIAGGNVVKLDRNGFQEGEYYFFDSSEGEYIAQMAGPDKGCSVIKKPNSLDASFAKNAHYFWDWGGITKATIRKATKEEKDWLDKCIQINSFVSKGRNADRNGMEPDKYYFFKHNFEGEYLVKYSRESCKEVIKDPNNRPDFRANRHLFWDNSGIVAETVRLATPEEVNWLQNCGKAGRLVDRSARIDSNGFEEDKYYKVIYSPTEEYITKVIESSRCKHLRIYNGSTSYEQSGTFWNNTSFAKSKIVEATASEKDWLDRCIASGKLEPREPRQVDRNGLEAGKYYVVKHSNGSYYLVLMKTGNSTYLCDPNKGGTNFCVDAYNFYDNASVMRDGTREATAYERQWLDECISQKKLIRKPWVGAYLKALVERPDSTPMKTGEYLEVTNVDSRRGKCLRTGNWSYTETFGQQWELMPFGFKPPVNNGTKLEVFPGFFVGDIVVYSGNYDKDWNEGSIGPIHETSKEGQLVIYNRLGNRVGSHWAHSLAFRKATEEEKAYYLKGGYNIKNMPSNQNTKVKAVDTETKWFGHYGFVSPRPKKKRSKMVSDIDAPVGVTVRPKKTTKMSEEC
jgi:hypothetical protein